MKLTDAPAPVAPHKPKLFLADDSRTMRNYYRGILEGDYEVSSFDDGAPLYQAALKSAPDVVVSDVNMPEMSGLELVRLLKQHPGLRPVPVILLTATEAAGEPGSGGSVDCLDAGADDYLQKPLKPAELLARVRSAHRAFDLYKKLEHQHHELEAAYRRLGEMEIELRQAQKLEAVGRLASGMAHEINTPIQYIVDNTSFALETFHSLAGLIGQYRSAIEAASREPLSPAIRAALLAVEKEADLELALPQTPLALASALEGASRIATIVRAMKDFGREDGAALGHADLNDALRSTLEVARAEYQAVADVETSWGAIPLVLCQVGAMNQAFLHLITNAAHAIAEVSARRGRRGTISVSTREDDEGVVVAIADTGGGIPAEIRQRVFDPFFTTKEVGRGSGQGLTVSRSIVEKHGGRLDFQTDMEKGTTFFVRLPTGRPAQVPAKNAEPPADLSKES